MSSSSDDSFVWTDASSDNSVDSDNMTAKVIDENHCNLENDSKTKLKEDFNTNNSSTMNGHKIQKKRNKRQIKEEVTDTENVSPPRKKIKVEPESDVDCVNKRNKLSEDITVHSITDQDNYLNARVKQEHSIITSATDVSLSEVQNSIEGNSEFTEVKKKKKSKKHKYRNSEEDESILQSKFVKTDVDSSIEETVIVNKKKKSKKNKLDDTKYEIDDKFSAEETIVQSPPRKKKHKSKQQANDDTQTSRKNSFNSNHSSIEESVSNITSNTSLMPGIEVDVLLKSKENDNLKDGTNQPSKIDTLTNSLPNNVSRRTSKISERIQFMDEDESDSSRNNNNDDIVTPSQLNRYLNLNYSLHRRTDPTYSHDALSEQDEVWIVNCPKEIDIIKFEGVSLAVEGKCKIKIDEQVYEGQIQKDNRVAFPCTDSDTVIKNCLLRGSILLRKRIPKAHMQNHYNEPVNANLFIPLPETKARHPLFGHDYKKAIKLPKNVAERLQVLEEENIVIKSEKKKKKKERKNREEVGSEASATPVESQTTHDERRAKKRKHSKERERPHKKVKRDRDASVAWESEKAIEENLFDY